MTSADIDAAFSAILVEITELAGLSTYLGTSPETLSQSANLIISTGPLKTVAGPFSTAEVSAILDSPALPQDLSTHNTRAAALLSGLSDKAALLEDFTSAACNLIGTHVDRTEQRTQDERWIFEVVLVVGVTAI